MLDCGCHIWTQKCRGSEKYLRLFFGREKHAVVGYSILCGSHRNQYSYLYQYTCCLLWWIPGFFAINVRLYPGAHCGCGLVSACLRSEEHTSELQSRGHLVCRLLLEKKK